MTPLGRALVWFWLAILAVTGTGMAALHLLGPPSSNTTGTALARVPDRPPTGLRRAGPTMLGPIAAPDPALLEALPTVPTGALPRIAADGRKPMELYAGAYDRTVTLPRVALLFYVVVGAALLLAPRRRPAERAAFSSKASNALA